MSLLSLRGLKKRFGGVAAVNGVSFDVEEGGIVGLIGPNGAGKTTLFNLITGTYRPDEGETRFDGVMITGLAMHRIAKLGISRTFQTIRLFQEMTVLENVLAGCHCRMASGLWAGMLHTRTQRGEEEKAVARAFDMLAFVGLETLANVPAGSLSYGRRRLLEVARGLAAEPRLLILDEPAGGMNEEETAALIGLIKKIRDQRVTVLLIEHDMYLVREACYRVVVMENGNKIAEGPPEAVMEDPAVIEAYLGMDEE